MSRIKFTVAYDGRSFEGWQSQPSGNTIQDHLERAFEYLTNNKIRIHGSGRTDAGVHARAQVFHVEKAGDCLPSIPESRWPLALNTRLPQSIRVTRAQVVSDEFHARFSAIGKQYRYIISTSAINNPFDAGLVWHLPYNLDLDLMRQAASIIRGEHDFKSFAASRGNEPDPVPDRYFVREIYHTDLMVRDRHIELVYRGSGFLYKMVRLLTGAIYSVGANRLTLKELAELLDAPRNRKSPLCAPASGLYLEEVHY